VVGVGINLQDARSKAYSIAEKVHYDGKIHRNDIGLDLLNYESI